MMEQPLFFFIRRRCTDAMNNERGVALLVTLSIMAILLAGAFSLHRTVLSHLVTQRTRLNNAQLEAMITSARQAAVALLIDDQKKTQIDSVQDAWADPEVIANTLKRLTFETGKLNYFIEDELGRIQINALVEYPQGRRHNPDQRGQEELWSRILDGFISADDTLFADIEESTIIHSLIDWLDFGDGGAITGLNGAESDYYESLDPPYTCRNGPLQHISELRWIRGMNETLFEGVEGQPGLRDFLTVHGLPEDDSQFTFTGEININTAPEPVIRALLPDPYSDLAKAIVDYRDEKADGQFVNDLSQPEWYKNVPGMGNVKIDHLITETSHLFRIRIAAEINGQQKGVMMIIQRKEVSDGKLGCQVIRRENDPGAVSLLKQEKQADE